MGESTEINRENFFNDLYQKQFSKMWVLAYELVHDADLAKEIVQDAFVEVLIHIDFLVGTEHPEFWLQKTVRNKVLHVRRAQARYTWRLISLDEEQIADDSAAKQLLEIEEAGEVKHIKNTMEETLSPEEIYLLKKVAMEGTTYKKLAAETGMSISACQKRIQRIRKKLKKRIPFR